MKKKNEYRERNALTAQSFELELDPELYLEVFHNHYLRTKNALFVWAAIQKAHELSVVLPGWIMEYLRESADQLLETEGGLYDKTHNSIAAALSLKTLGGGSSFTQFRNYLRNIQICLRVQEEREQRSKRNDSSIFTEVGREFGLGGNAVGKIVEKHAELLNEEYKKQLNVELKDS